MECLLRDKSVNELSFTVCFGFFFFFDSLLAFGFLCGSSLLGSFGHSTGQSVLFFPQIGLLMNSVIVFPGEGGARFAVDGFKQALLSFPRISIQTLHEVGSCESKVVESPDAFVTLELTDSSIPHVSLLKGR